MGVLMVSPVRVGACVRVSGLDVSAAQFTFQAFGVVVQQSQEFLGDVADVDIFGALAQGADGGAGDSVRTHARGRRQLFPFVLARSGKYRSEERRVGKEGVSTC